MGNCVLFARMQITAARLASERISKAFWHFFTRYLFTATGTFRPSIRAAFSCATLCHKYRIIFEHANSRFSGKQQHAQTN